MLTQTTALRLLLLSLAPALISAQASSSSSSSPQSVDSATIVDIAGTPAMSSQPPATGATHSFWENIGRHWTEADSNKQTLMALFLIVQLVGLFWAIKGSLDKLFGRRVEYRNKRTKRFARRAAVAAAGGSSKSGIPLSHQRPLYRADIKPQLPPRPSQDHSLMRDTPSTSQNTLQTSPTGEIILPSWSDSGPTPLKVIVEEPEDISRSNSPVHSRPHSPAVHRDYPHSPTLPVHTDAPQHSWSFRATSPRDSTSLRCRERSDYAMLPFNIDRSSTPDTRLEDVERPFSRPIFHEERSSQSSPSHSYTPLPTAAMQSTSPA